MVNYLERGVPMFVAYLEIYQKLEGMLDGYIHDLKV